MAMIGTIKELSIDDGQIVAIVETGSGPAITATVLNSGGSEFHPMEGDSVLYHKAGQEIVIDAVFSVDTTTDKGESLLFSRDDSGSVVATFYLKKNGAIEIKPGPGQTAGVGNATNFVAMAHLVDILWATLWGVFNAWVPPTAPAIDNGAALKTAFLAAFPPPGPDSVASSNLKAD